MGIQQNADGRLMRILVFNCGSSSLKFELIELQEYSGQRLESARRLARGTFEEIGPHSSIRMSDQGSHEVALSEAITDHHAAAVRAMDWLGQLGDTAIDAVAHRIVHGGEHVTVPTLVTNAVIDALDDASQFAPLHNPPALSVLQAARQLLRDIPAVIITDTGFHRSIPPAARNYAIPRRLADRYGIRRFGFHGIGHAWMMERCAEMRGTVPERLNLVTLHLGAGCSATAIKQGRSVDTSMGLTPLEGLMMATRSGDIDPAIFSFLAAREKLSPDQVERILNRESGLLGVSSVSDDLREIEAAAAQNQDAALAIEMFCYRVRKYIGAYMAILGHTDAIVFGGGIGEHSDTVRARVCIGLEQLGIILNQENNRSANSRQACISEQHSPVGVYVIPLDEELYIARIAARMLRESATVDI
jgi:acetate kinase